MKEKKKENLGERKKKKEPIPWQDWTASRSESARRSQLLGAAIPRTRPLGRGRCAETQRVQPGVRLSGRDTRAAAQWGGFARQAPEHVECCS